MQVFLQQRPDGQSQVLEDVSAICLCSAACVLHAAHVGLVISGKAIVLDNFSSIEQACVLHTKSLAAVFHKDPIIITNYR
jgi:hypothetical protein